MPRLWVRIGIWVLLIQIDFQWVCSLCYEVDDVMVQFTDTSHVFCIDCIYNEQDVVSLHPPSCLKCEAAGTPQNQNCLTRSALLPTRELIMLGEIRLVQGIFKELEDNDAICIQCRLCLRFKDRQNHHH